MGFAALAKSGYSTAGGKHLGSMDPVTGEMIKPAVPGRTIDV
jgi:hypothetical protein